MTALNKTWCKVKVLYLNADLKTLIRNYFTVHFAIQNNILKISFLQDWIVLYIHQYVKVQSLCALSEDHVKSFNITQSKGRLQCSKSAVFVQHQWGIYGGRLKTISLWGGCWWRCFWHDFYLTWSTEHLAQDSGEEREGESGSKPLDPGIQAQLGPDDLPHPLLPSRVIIAINNKADSGSCCKMKIINCASMKPLLLCL